MPLRHPLPPLARYLAADGPWAGSGKNRGNKWPEGKRERKNVGDGLRGINKRILGMLRVIKSRKTLSTQAADA